MWSQHIQHEVFKHCLSDHFDLPPFPPARRPFFPSWAHPHRTRIHPHPHYNTACTLFPDPCLCRLPPIYIYRIKACRSTSLTNVAASAWVGLSVQLWTNQTLRQIAPETGMIVSRTIQTVCKTLARESGILRQVVRCCASLLVSRSTPYYCVSCWATTEQKYPRRLRSSCA